MGLKHVQKVIQFLFSSLPNLATDLKEGLKNMTGLYWMNWDMYHSTKEVLSSQQISHFIDGQGGKTKRA